MKKIIYKIYLALLVLAIASCVPDLNDNTGASSMNIEGTPSLSIDLPLGTVISTVENDSEYPFTVTLSEAKPYDIIVTLSQTAGDAELGVDYEMPEFVTIFANALSTSGVIKVLADDLAEATETSKIVIGGSANGVNLAPLTVDLSILNVTADDLVIDMSWSIKENITDNYGNTIAAPDVADLRLLLTNIPFTGILASADGAGFENYVLTADKPDGEYYIVADFFGAMDNVITDINLESNFNQVGVINNDTYNYSSALTTEFACPAAYYILNKIVKLGNTYTVTSVGAPAPLTTVTPGIYNVVSNGTNTDGQPAAVNLPYSVTITDNGGGNYSISDGVAGVYIFWYSIYGYTFETEGNFTQTPCGLEGSWGDAFGATINLTGTSNADGTLNIHWSNSFGDMVDAVYTPQ